MKNNIRKGGTGATLIAVFLAATFAGGVSIAGMTSTFTQAFDQVNFEDTFQWLESFIGPNVKAACETDDKQAFPANGNLSNELDRIEAVRIKEKETLHGLGDTIRVFQVKYNGGDKKGFSLDVDGWWGNDFACDSGNGIQFNNTTHDDIPHGDWVPTPQGQVQNFRILEEDPSDVRIQVMHD